MTNKTDKEDMAQKAHYEALVNMHQTFLDALRHREQDILRFVAILGTALGGFIWLLGVEGMKEPARFVVGTYGVLLVLVVGAFYALALGYNYRYLILQVAKLESDANLGVRKSVLSYWSRKPEDFIPRCRWGIIPWSTPPGIIKVFWIAFLLSILGVTTAASVVQKDPFLADTKQTQAGQPARTAAAEQAVRENHEMWMLRLSPVPYVGAACFLFALFGPIHVGRKMLIACEKEDPEEWKAPKNQISKKPQPEKPDGRQREDKD